MLGRRRGARRRRSVKISGPTVAELKRASRRLDSATEGMDDAIRILQRFGGTPVDPELKRVVANLTKLYNSVVDATDTVDNVVTRLTLR